MLVDCIVLSRSSHACIFNALVSNKIRQHHSILYANLSCNRLSLNLRTWVLAFPVSQSRGPVFEDGESCTDYSKCAYEAALISSRLDDKQTPQTEMR